LNSIEKNDNTDSVIMLNGDADVAAIIVHGFSDTPASMMPLAENLHASLGITCIMPLLQGHGTSIDDFEQASYEQWIAQVEHAYSEAASRFSHVFLIGFSMGGLLATIACASRCAGRILIAPAFDVGIQRQMKLWLLPIIQYFKRYNYKNPEHTTYNRNLYDPVMREKYRLFYDREPLRAIIQYGFIRKRALLRIRDVPSDSLVILSKADRVVDFFRTKAIIATHQPTWRIIELDRSGHMIPLDYDREIVFTVVKEFIRNKIVSAD